MKRLFRKSSSAKASEDENFSQEKMVASPAPQSPTVTTLSSRPDDSSKMSVSELTSASGSAPKPTPVPMEQPGLMLVSEEETTPQPSNDKEVALKSDPNEEVARREEGSTDAHDEESGTNSTLPAYEEHAGASKSKDVSSDIRKPSLPSQDAKIDLLSQEVLAPDGTEKEIVVPDRTRSHPPLIKSPSQQQHYRTYREYSFYYTNAMTHLIICDPDSQALYFAESSAFTKSKSDILLYDIANAPDSYSHRGSSLSYKEAVTAPIVASADFVQANNVKIGLGDPVQPESATWMMMRNIYNDSKNNVEKFEVLVPGVGADSKETVYQWNRGSAEEGGKGRRKSSTDKTNSKETFKMTLNDEVVASFRNASMASIKKRGQLRVYETPLVDDIMLLIFVSFISFCEKERRRKVKKSLLLGL